MSKVEKILPTFGNFKEKRKLGVLLFGIFSDNPDSYQTNKSLQIAVQQSLILATYSTPSNNPPPSPSHLSSLAVALKKCLFIHCNHILST